MNEKIKYETAAARFYLEIAKTLRKPKKELRLHGCGCVSDLAGNRFYTLCYYHEKEVVNEH